MEYVIAKAFKTLIHRFKVGDAVNRSYDLQPYTFDELVERGDIKEAAVTEKPDEHSVASAHAAPRSMTDEPADNR